ncbi:hypothetical protein, partial [Mesorhizobium sp.]|uniref:hypothetical protein n=1 Tax=Mesorhizobium sp. TaxID=1871066 RepID=UPI0025809BD5
MPPKNGKLLSCIFGHSGKRFRQIRDEGLVFRPLAGLVASVVLANPAVNGSIWRNHDVQGGRRQRLLSGNSKDHLNGRHGRKAAVGMLQRND